MIRCSCGAELFSIESICSVCIPSKPPRALFVEDLRIKLANRELEILDWKEAAEIANAENDTLRHEVAAATKHAKLLNKMLGEAEARAERLREAIKHAKLLNKMLGEAEARAERLREAIVAFVTYADQQPGRIIGSGAGGQTMEATLRASGRLVSDWHIGQLEEALNEPIEDDKQ